MSEKIKQFVKEFLKENLPDVKVGDTVKVYQRIPASESAVKGKKQSDKDRVQIFEGIVVSIKHGRGIKGTLTVRKIISGIGVEKTFPFHTPTVDKIEIISRSKARRAKLYYLRERVGKKAKLKRKDYVPGQETLAQPEPKPAEPPAEPAVEAEKEPQPKPEEAKAKEKQPRPETEPKKRFSLRRKKNK